MLRSLTLAIILTAPAGAQIWPDDWHGSARGSAEAVKADDAMLWIEYGGEAAERAIYNGPVGKFSATAWRFRDTTGALAFYQSVRPENCTGVYHTPLVCTTPGSEILTHQNYVLRFDGWRPTEKELIELYSKLPRLRSAGGMPLLPGYLPEKGRVRNSERYVLGVHSLQKFVPGIPAALPGLEDGVEAQVGKFTTRGGEVTAAIFSYPTPQMARAKADEFEKSGGYYLKRTGPLLAVIPGGAGTSSGSEVFGDLEWKAQFMWDQATKPPPMPNVASMLVSIFQLTGIMLLVCLGGGGIFALIRVQLRKRRIRLDGSDNPLSFIEIRD